MIITTVKDALDILVTVLHNNWSWSHIKSAQSKQTQTLKSPKNASTATKNFYTIRDAIVKNCRANKFNDTLNFDTVIKNLS